ncbi:hypothetical protein F503_02087 [Ophiostoma piceae UAMH 11346]|uniref:Uncharacterized protein n=1 Tax=Ophiostoma piceae (strain UAMH 11346) TaxID=1262450 RepID=S3CGD8_OPHP1|nr:hypothetical protein F503_02087 [Ophiostoma piceae UAMH 11346]
MRLTFVIACTLLRVAAASARVAVVSTQARLPTSVSYWNRHVDSDDPFLQYKRAATTTTADLITCGYQSGNVNSPRSAQSGFDCRVDTAHGVWGFCPTSVIVATDCGLAAACIDSGSCSGICHINTDTALTTFTCPSSGTETLFCSTAMLTFGVDQTYGYIACAGKATTDHYVVTPTFTPSSSTTSTSKSSSKTPTSSSKTPSTSSTPSPTSTATLSSLTTAAETAKSTSPNTADTKTQSTGSNLGPIIGGVLGGIALVCLSAVAVVFIIKRRGSHNARSAPPPDMLSAPPYSSYPPPHAGAQIYEVDSSSSGQKLFWKDPTPNLNPHPRSPVELPSHMNY